MEWYELFLYVYWTPLISKLFFSSDSAYVASLKTLFVFAIGFIARPIGGLFFGHIGDKYGRKVSFVRSITLMILPSIAMGILPSLTLGAFAPVLLCILRFFQALPAGGELPGAMCYLSECAPENKRAWACSFSFFGPQIGVIVSMLECYFLEKYMSHENLVNWGWRLSFVIGGLLGFAGYYIRHKLKESPAFEKLEKERKVFHKPIVESILRHKKEIAAGFFSSFLDVIGFYLFSIFLGIYFHRVINISESENLLITAFSMSISTLTLPFLGMLGDRYKIKRLLAMSAIGMLVFLYPFYLASAGYSSFFFTTVFQLVLMLLLNVQYAILPCFIAELFPTSTRYTGIGMSFNLCDSIVGGVTPLLALLLTHYIGDVGAFVTLISFGAVVSLTAFFFIKERSLHRI